MELGMTIASGALGVLYVVIGLLTMWEVLVWRRRRGLSRFGMTAAVVVIACGVHHVALALADGDHMMDTGATMLVATTLSIPPAAMFALLRVGALRRRTGDVLLSALPIPSSAVPALFGVTSGVLIGAAVSAGPVAFGVGTGVNLGLFAIYAVLGWMLLATQSRHHRRTGQWSLSGVSLGWLFPSCGLSHLVHALGAPAAGALTSVDLVGALAGIHLVVLVRGLHRRTVEDWNRRPVSTPVVVPDRASPWAA